MLSQCLGTQKRIKPMVRQIITKPMSRPKSTPINRSSNGEKLIDYSAAFVLENNHTRLQNAQLSACKGMIKIFSESLTKTKAWKKKWYEFCVNNQDDVTSCESVWTLFATSISAVDSFIEEMDQTVESLKDVRDSIPIPQKDQSLKFKMDQARSNVDKLTTKINELEKEERKIKRKLDRLESNTPSTLMKNVDCQTPQDDLTERHNQIETSLEKKKTLLEKEEKLFRKEQAKLFDESKKYELKRCHLLKEQSKTFVESLDLNSDEFSEELEKFNPEKDLHRWEEQIFPRQAKQSGKSKSTENEISDGNIV